MKIGDIALALENGVINREQVEFLFAEIRSLETRMGVIRNELTKHVAVPGIDKVLELTRR